MTYRDETWNCERDGHLWLVGQRECVGCGDDYGPTEPDCICIEGYAEADCPVHRAPPPDNPDFIASWERFRRAQ